MLMTRRGFLKMFAAAPAVMILPAQGSIWLPQATLDLPEIKEVEAVTEAMLGGGIIGVYFIGAAHYIPMVHYDAINYFNPGTPIVALKGGASRFGRAYFRGDREALLRGQQRKMLAGWEVGDLLQSESYQ